MQFSTLTEKKNQEHIGGASLIFIQRKTFFLFDSFGFAGFKEFIVDNDINIVDKLLFNFKKCNKKDTKTDLVSLTLSVENYKKIKKN